MAAPQSNPEFSVVESEQKSDTPNESPRSDAGAATASKPAAPAPSLPPQRPAPAETGGERRRAGLPIWVTLVVALVGVLAFVSQYQRAVQLDAEVQALGNELAQAGEQIQAYRDHLDQVRLGVADLSDRIGGLKALADRDPLAPALEAQPSEAPKSGAPTLAPEAETLLDESAGAAATGTSLQPELSGLDETALIEGALATPLTSAPEPSAVVAEGPVDPLTVGIPGYSTGPAASREASRF